MVLTIAKQVAKTSVMTISSLLSIFGSGCIIYINLTDYCRSSSRQSRGNHQNKNKKKLHHLYHRLIFVLSCYDIIFSTSVLLQPWLANAELYNPVSLIPTFGNDISCTIIGFIFTTAHLSVSLTNCFLSISFKLSIVNGMTERAIVAKRYEMLWYLMIVIVPLLIGILTIYYRGYNLERFSKVCNFENPDPETTDDMEWFYLGLIWIAIEIVSSITGFVSAYQVYKKVKHQTTTMIQKYDFESQLLNMTKSANNLSTTNHAGMLSSTTTTTGFTANNNSAQQRIVVEEEETEEDDDIFHNAARDILNGMEREEEELSSTNNTKTNGDIGSAMPTHQNEEHDIRQQQQKVFTSSPQHDEQQQQQQRQKPAERRNSVLSSIFVLPQLRQISQTRLNDRQDPPVSHKHHHHHHHHHQNHYYVNEVGIQVVLYSLAYLNSMIWPFLVAIFAIILAPETGQMYGLDLLSSTFFPLQGFLNFFIYIRPTYKQYKRRSITLDSKNNNNKSCASWMRIIRMIILQPSSLDWNGEGDGSSKQSPPASQPIAEIQQ